MDKRMKLYIGIVVVIIIALGAILGVKVFGKKQNVKEITVDEPEKIVENTPVLEKKEDIKIFNRKR